MNKLINAIQAFASEEDGSQIIEYGLIVAVISLVLITAIGALGDGSFALMIAQVGTCLAGGECTWP